MENCVWKINRLKWQVPGGESRPNRFQDKGITQEADRAGCSEEWTRWVEVEAIELLSPIFVCFNNDCNYSDPYTFVGHRGRRIYSGLKLITNAATGYFEPRSWISIGLITGSVENKMVWIPARLLREKKSINLLLALDLQSSISSGVRHLTSLADHMGYVEYGDLTAVGSIFERVRFKKIHFIYNYKAFMWHISRARWFSSAALQSSHRDESACPKVSGLIICLKKHNVPSLFACHLSISGTSWL